MVYKAKMIDTRPGKVVPLPEEYDLISHVSGVFSDDGASTFIANMMSEDDHQQRRKRRMKRAHSISSIPEDVHIQSPNGETSATPLDNQLSSEQKPTQKPKRKSLRSSKNQNAKPQGKKTQSRRARSVSPGALAMFRDDPAEHSISQSEYSSSLQGTIPQPPLTLPPPHGHSHTPPPPSSRYSSSPSISSRKRVSKRTSPSPSRTSTIRSWIRTTSRSDGRRVSPSPAGGTKRGDRHILSSPAGGSRRGDRRISPSPSGGGTKRGDRRVSPSPSGGETKRGDRRVSPSPSGGETKRGDRRISPSPAGGSRKGDRRIARSPAGGSRKGDRRVSPSPAGGSKRGERRVSPTPSGGSKRGDRRITHSPRRSASPHVERTRTLSRKRLPRSRSTDKPRSASPSSRSAGSSSYGTYGSHQNSRRSKSKTRSTSRSISPGDSSDLGSPSGASRRRSKTTRPSQIVHERTLSPVHQSRQRQSGRLSSYLNDNEPENTENCPFRRLKPRSPQNIRRKSNRIVEGTKDAKYQRRRSDPLLARSLRLQSPRSGSSSCKNPHTASRQSPSISRRRVSGTTKRISSNRQTLIQIANNDDDWDAEDSVMWRQPSKASIMNDDESSWTREWNTNTSIE
eukprot:scaffold1775_cov83-Cylindrotheca_fusiformis.AAC.6